MDKNTKYMGWGIHFFCGYYCIMPPGSWDYHQIPFYSIEDAIEYIDLVTSPYGLLGAMLACASAGGDPKESREFLTGFVGSHLHKVDGRPIFDFIQSQRAT